MNRKAHSLKSCMLVITLVCVFNLLMVSGGAVSISNGASNSTEYYENLIALQRNAVMANEMISRSLPRNDYGEIIYPDDWAGDWIDDDILVIMLTDISPEHTAKYESMLGEYIQYVRFEVADYSYNYLADQAEVYVDNLAETADVDVYSYYVSVMSNEIVIGVDPDDYNELTKTNIILQDDLPIRFEEDVPSEPGISLEGGSKLYNADAGEAFSIGCCGVAYGETSILTCGHINQSLDDEIRYENSSGDTIGYVTHHKYYDGSRGDFEIVSVDLDTFDVTNQCEDGSEFVGTLSDSTVGGVVRCYGQRTGETTYSEIVATNVTVIDNLGNGQLGNTIRGLTRAEITSGDVQSGDSGGPVYVPTPTRNECYFIGVIHGTSSSNGKDYFSYTPWNLIEGSGFNIRTY